MEPAAEPVATAAATVKSKAERTRNLCILAHVDHGKTTLADCLIATNGIIPGRSVARLRYMDSLEQEQERGITMKSSLISLVYSRPKEFRCTGDSDADSQYVVNLIDSPGHIDFSSEVSAAVRLSDGAVVVVDAVEGVSPQTVAVLRQAWRECVTPVLLINKMDRLILELRLTPADAYQHLWKLIESVNALMAELYRMDFFERQEQQQQQPEPTEEKTTDEEGVTEVTLTNDWLSGLESASDEHVYFAPARGNVVFASALDGWGFRVEDFARLTAKRLGFSERILSRTLWGDYFYSAKEKKVYRGASLKGRKPLFVQLVLENLWTVYDTFVVNRDPERIARMCASLDVRLAQRDLKAGADPRATLAAFSAQWLPVARAVLEAVVTQCPSPRQLSVDKVDRLLTFSTVAQLEALRRHFLACSPDGPLIAFVSKLMPIPADCVVELGGSAGAATSAASTPSAAATQELEQRRLEARRKWEAMKLAKAAAATADNDNNVAPSNGSEVAAEEQAPASVKMIHVAFCRIYSGVIRPGDRLFVLSPRHRPDHLPADLEADLLTPQTPDVEKRLAEAGVKYATVCTVGRVLLMRGRDFESVPGAGAGAIVGVEGLVERVVKTATLSASLACPAFTDMASEAAPIIRVAVECANPADQGRLLAGLRLLEKNDPCAEVLLEENGETVVCSSGEVHLAKCLHDLRNCFAKVEFTTSKIVVPFRETLITDDLVAATAAAASAADPDADPDDDEEAPPEELLSLLEIGGEAVALAKDDPEVLEPSRGLVCCRVQVRESDRQLVLTVRAVPLPDTTVRLLEEHAEVLKRARAVPPAALLDGLQRELAAAGRLLADCRVLAAGPRRDPCNLLALARDARLPASLGAPPSLQQTPQAAGASAISTGPSSHLWQALVNGFQWISQQGPMCREPLRGVAFVLTEACELVQQQAQPDLTIAAGQLMSHASRALGKAFLCHANRRLMLAAYTVDVQCKSEVLGKVHAVLAKHQGRIVSEELREGTNMFLLRCHMPVVESFGLADELRKRTSGFAAAQLRFTHWAPSDWDPLLLPREDDDLRDERMRSVNYLMGVRRLKGMPVRDQIVEHADKQRTRSRKK